MANFFEQFDTAKKKEPSENFFAKFDKQPEETSNPLKGSAARAVELGASGVEAYSRVAKPFGVIDEALNKATPFLGMLNMARRSMQGKEGLEKENQALDSMQDWASSSRDYAKDIGYAPSTKLGDIPSNPLNLVPFIAERIITSVPDMVAAVTMPKAYVAARTNEILNDRLKNDEKTIEQATVGDVAAAATGAVIETSLERFATKGLFKGATPGKTAGSRIGTQVGIQSGTEALEEGASNIAGSAGTKRGVDYEELGTAMLEGAIVGGGFGGTIQGVKEGVNRYLKGDEKKTGKSVLDRLTEEEDVGQVIPPAGGESTSLAGQPGAGSSAGRTTRPKPDGMVSTGQDVTDVDTGAGQPASSLANFQEAYNNLRQEIVPLLGGGIQTPEKTTQIKMAMRDLNNLVDDNANLINDPKLINQLKNPMFDGSSIVGALAAQDQSGQARGMQSDMFGTIKRTAQMARDAMAMAGGDVTKAVANLEAAKQRYIAKLQAGAYDENWAITQAGPGMTAGEAVRSRQQLAEQHVARLAEQIDQAIEQLQRPARGMQSADPLRAGQIETGVEIANNFGGGNRAAAVQWQQGRIQKLQQDAQLGPENAPDYLYNTAGGEALKSPEAYKTYFDNLISLNQEVLSQLQGTPRAMQGNLLGEGAWSNVKRTTKGDVEIIPTSSLDRAAQRNKADTSTPEYEALKASIQAKGIVDPIIITTNSLGRAEVFEGNHRLQAARELGIKEIPVVLHSRTNSSESYPVVGRKPSSLLAETEKQINEERVKPIPQDAQTAEMVGESTDAATQARVEAARKSAEIEKRNKGKDQAVTPSMTPLERVLTLEDREADLVNQLEKTETQKVGSSLGVEEKDLKAGLQTELVGVRRDLEAARAEVASRKSTPAVTPAEQVTTTPTTVESTQEQNDMFGKPVVQKQQRKGQPKKERKDLTPLDEDFEEFGAPVEGDADVTATAEPVQYDQKGDPIEAPDTSTEHIAQTTEGGQVKEFFDLIQPIAETSTEQERHNSSKNVAAKVMLQYDIASAGESSSPGARSMLKYLTSRVGGVNAFKALMDALRRASPEEQGRLYTKAGIPDLTTRRGIEQFSDEVREYVSQLSGKGVGVGMPKSGIYTERITTGTAVTQKFGKTAGGKPRRPSQGVTETEHVIADGKLRGALLAIKQSFTAGTKMSPQMSAAMTYLNNLNRDTFGQAMSALAYDLAYYAVDPKYFNANYGYFGEGGRYANNFREWVKENLSPSTLATLDEMVEQHKQTHEANVAYTKAVADYHESLKRYEEQLAKEAKERATIVEKKNERKLKRISERLAETTTGEGEATPDVEVSTKNLPTLQMLTEVHPDMVRMLEAGDTRGALDLMVQMKSNPYYAELAKRLLDTGFTAKTRIVDADTMESLNNDPNIGKSLKERIDGLRDVIIAIYPVDQQGTLIAELRSGKLRNVLSALAQIEASMDQMNASESNKQVLQGLIDLVNTQYTWSGKYDPATDSIVMRRGVGKLTNHLLLHETIHAAASHLLDNPERLSGFQRQGYDRLMELYTYAKTQLQQEGADTGAIYGLKDLHEFVSEALTNPVFQAKLRAYRYKAAPYSLQNRFTDAIRRLFNVKKGYESNVMAEAMLAADAMMAGTMSVEGMTVTTGPKAMATGKRKPKVTPTGMPNQPSTIRRWMQTRNWSQVKREYRNINAALRPAFLGVLTLRQIDDLVAGRIPQIKNFIRVTEDFLARKSNILEESAKISRRWELLQSKDPDMSRKLGAVMHSATIAEVDPDKATTSQRNLNVQLMIDWRALNPEAQTIYRETRNFFQRRYSNYKRLMNRRIIQMRQLGVSEATILEIRNEFEKGALKGPYFPLMRFGRFWYQIGRSTGREYYMFDSQGARDAHIEERLERDPYLSQTIGNNIGNDYAKQMDLHASQSTFLKEVFAAVDTAKFVGLSPTAADARKKELKDSFYQTFLQNQPDRSMRNQFIHRNSVEGFSQDALRNFTVTSFNMAYQLARFEFSPEMFSQMSAARSQVKRRIPAGASYDPALAAENDELRDFIKETELKLNAMLNPPDDGAWVSYFSNIGFIYYLTSVASSVTNILGGIMIGVPTLVGQQVKADPNMSYTRAVANVMGQVSKTIGQIGFTGFGIETGGRIRDSRLLTPSLQRSNSLTSAEQAAYRRFVADGLIDITAAYDQSGLASKPTEDYSGIPNKSMQVISFLFHHAERINREVVAMSSFRAAMERRANYPNQQQAFAEAIAEAKDVTHRSMFDYSAPNKPRYMQHPVARVILQFKQFPQQMTFFLVTNAWNSIFTGKLTKAEKREARARFVGIMGTSAIMTGVTGLWNFSTVASIIEAVFNYGLDSDDEDRLDFELAFMNWAVNTLGKEAGMLLGRGAFNALGYDFASKLKLDGMWIPDSRQNLDAQTALNDTITKTLGPFVGILQQGARAYDLFKTGHGDRALEAMMPAFIRQPMVAYRYSKEGATNMAGDKIVDEFSPFDLAMQSLGFRTSELAERQYFNITKKGQAEGITKKRTEALNLFGLYFMTNDSDGVEKALDQIIKFNAKHPTAAIDVDGIISSIEKKLEKSAKTDQGLYIDDKLRHIVTQDYVDKLKKDSKPAKKKANYFEQFQ